MAHVTHGCGERPKTESGDHQRNYGDSERGFGQPESFVARRPRSLAITVHSYRTPTGRETLQRRAASTWVWLWLGISFERIKDLCSSGGADRKYRWVSHASLGGDHVERLSYSVGSSNGDHGELFFGGSLND